MPSSPLAQGHNRARSHPNSVPWPETLPQRPVPCRQTRHLPSWFSSIEGSAFLGPGLVTHMSVVDLNRSKIHAHSHGARLGKVHADILLNTNGVVQRPVVTNYPQGASVHAVIDPDGIT